MTALKLPPPALAVLAIGAIWWLSQRRAVAGLNRVTGNPTYGRQRAVSNGATQRYMIPPSGITPAVGYPLQSLLSFASGLIGRPAASAAGVATLAQTASAYGQGGPSTGVYGIDAAMVRPANYQPTYTPDAQGEAAAQAYYLSNPDEFISNPPPLIAYTQDQILTTGGWLDGQ